MVEWVLVALLALGDCGLAQASQFANQTYVALS
jgi:hypothetical protein